MSPANKEGTWSGCRDNSAKASSNRVGSGHRCGETAYRAAAAAPTKAAPVASVRCRAAREGASATSQRPQPQHRREQQGAHHAQVDQHPHAGAQQHEGTGGAAPERPLGEAQAHHEEGGERRVLGVEERVRVEPRVQREGGQREQRRPQAAKQPAGQQRRGRSAGEEGEVREQVPREVDVAAVHLPQRALDHRQRRLEGGAVVPQPIKVWQPPVPERRIVPKREIHRGMAQIALIHGIVRRDAVVIMDRDPQHSQQPQRGRDADPVPCHVAVAGGGGVVCHGSGRQPPGEVRQPLPCRGSTTSANQSCSPPNPSCPVRRRAMVPSGSRRHATQRPPSRASSAAS